MFLKVLEELLKFLVNFTWLKYVKSKRSYGFLITKDLIFGFQILDLKDHFSASLKQHYAHIYRTDQFNPKTEDSFSNKELEHSLDTYLII